MARAPATASAHQRHASGLGEWRYEPAEKCLPLDAALHFPNISMLGSCSSSPALRQDILHRKTSFSFFVSTTL
jgi:hypothetical protein